MNETTFGDIHDIYAAAQDVMDRHNLNVVTDVEAGADDWVRMIDATGVVVKLEEKLAKKTKDFRAFREARIGHDYITHSEMLEAENAELKRNASGMRALLINSGYSEEDIIGRFGSPDALLTAEDHDEQT